MALTDGSMHHVALKVVDLAAAESFYRRVLGLRVLRRWRDERGQPRSVWLALGRTGLLMLEKAVRRHGRARMSAAGPGWHLVALAIAPSSRTRVERRLAAMGIAIEDRTDYTLYLRDPEGNRVGLSHYPRRATSRPAR